LHAILDDGLFNEKVKEGGRNVRVKEIIGKKDKYVYLVTDIETNAVVIFTSVIKAVKYIKCYKSLVFYKLYVNYTKPIKGRFIVELANKM